MMRYTSSSRRRTARRKRSIVGVGTPSGKSIDIPLIRACMLSSAAAFAAALESMQARINGMSMLLPDGVPTPTMLRLRRAVRRLDELVYRIIRERRASDQERGDLL